MTREETTALDQDTGSCLALVQPSVEEAKSITNLSTWMLVAGILSLIAGISAILSVVNIFIGLLGVLNGIWWILAGRSLSKYSAHGNDRLDHKELHRACRNIRNIFLSRAIFLISAIIVLVAIFVTCLFLYQNPLLIPTILFPQ